MRLSSFIISSSALSKSSSVAGLPTSGSFAIACVSSIAHIPRPSISEQHFIEYPHCNMEMLCHIWWITLLMCQTFGNQLLPSMEFQFDLWLMLRGYEGTPNLITR